MSDRRELSDDLGAMMRAAMRGHQASLWTALPAIVSKFDPVKMTCEAQPSIKAQFTDQDGVRSWVALPMLLDCPVVFPSAGGFSLTFPLAAGDEVLVVFASRCIDSWWQSGGVQVQPDLRLHDLSDGFAIPGPRSVPRALPAVSQTEVQLRSDDGATVIAIDRQGSVRVEATNVHVTATNGASIVAAQASVQAASIALDGAVTVTGDLTVSGALVAPNFKSSTPGKPDYLHHRHDADHGINLGPPVPL